MSEWTKAIPERLDRWQSRVLVWVVGAAIFCSAWWQWSLVCGSKATTNDKGFAWLTLGVSLTFAIVVWLLKAATPMAAVCGGAICELVLLGTGRNVHQPSLIYSGLSPLLVLFVLTFAATKAGKSRKQRFGVAESKRGRSAAQVLANLGAAGLASGVLISGCASGFHGAPLAAKVALLGCLAEATADTVSSEIGAAFGGRPFLVTTFKRVEAGTDGAISWLGTFAGCVGATIVVAVGVWSIGLTVREGLAAFVGGVAGLGFDSLLGATVERRGWLGNDWVNFLSTLVGGVVAWAVAVW